MNSPVEAELLLSIRTLCPTHQAYGFTGTTAPETGQLEETSEELPRLFREATEALGKQRVEWRGEWR